MSIQLYTLNCLLEVYYSQNTDPKYISYLEQSITDYVEKCDKRIIEFLSHLRGKLSSNKLSLPNLKNSRGAALNKLNKSIDELSSQRIGDRQKELLTALHAISNSSQFLVSSSGEVYVSC